MNVNLTGIIVSSICTVLCLVAVVLFSITTIKSHCCDRQYSRKQRIILYLLLVSLGSLLTRVSFLIWNRNCRVLYVYILFEQLHPFVLCWAAVYLCFDVFTTLSRREFRGRNYRFCGGIAEVCLLAVITVVSIGCTAVVIMIPTHGHPHQWCHNNSKLYSSLSSMLWFAPYLLVTLISIVSIVLVLVQLCVACRRVQAREVMNRLRNTIVETVILIVFMTGHCIIVGVWFAYSVVVFIDGRNVPETFCLIFFELLLPLHDAFIPCGFIIFFGRRILQELGCQCCCGRCGRNQGYVPLQGGIFSVRSPMSSTTWTYYTCDDSQPSEWFRAGPAPDPPVQQ